MSRLETLKRSTEHAVEQRLSPLAEQMEALAELTQELRTAAATASQGHRAAVLALQTATKQASDTASRLTAKALKLDAQADRIERLLQRAPKPESPWPPAMAVIVAVIAATVFLAWRLGIL